jgi:hypothetical protein
MQQKQKRDVAAAPRVMPIIDPNQTAMIARFRRESVLDRSIPLGVGPQYLKPDRGPITSRYYQNKHRRGEFGKYWLHQVFSFSRDRS